MSDPVEKRIMMRLHLFSHSALWDVVWNEHGIFKKKKLVALQVQFVWHVVLYH